MDAHRCSLLLVAVLLAGCLGGQPRLARDGLSMDAVVIDVAERITAVASGERSNSTDIPERVRVRVNGSADRITIVHPRDGSRRYPSTFTLIHGTSQAGTATGSGSYAIAGADRTVVVFARSNASTDIYRIETRRMRTPGPDHLDRRIDLLGDAVGWTRSIHLMPAGTVIRDGVRLQRIRVRLSGQP